MIYDSAQAWADAPAKRICLFGMSGLGKTHVSNLLRETGGWFHYSVDYRIGTRYMGEHIADSFKAEAMRVPYLRELLLSDSIYIASNITFHNLAPLSMYLGKPGDPAKGGLSFDEYMRRQELHRMAEINAMLDSAHFIERARTLYGYDHFVCDSSGSLCEVVDPEDTADPVLNALSRTLLFVWIEGSDAHTEALVRRFDRAPKPMYYQPAFLHAAWLEYLGETGLEEDEVDPNAFVRWTYARALAERQPRYRAIAQNWGVTLAAEDVARVTAAEEFEALVGDAIAARTG
ncbi:ATPase [Ovoidimarina sediminis]|uniref:ATPase n=1 Tax=Ovoidimarina sediminis TaxID=3079856 RepID=UPI00290FABB5|nr:ATPase [Rhodophyticola sp. MJ-SS7]MDU8945027.1 ATPase [Rhodophyticola sp. MJ-SS7]